MKAIILAAGYATRLYPLTRNFPKPLLKIKDKTIIDWLIDDLKDEDIDEYFVVSNHRHIEHFEQWKKDKDSRIRIIDDGTTENENRLGALRDMELAIDFGQIDDDVLIMAGDNVLDFSLKKLVAYFRDKGTSCVMKYEEKNIEKLRRSGVARVEDDLIVEMQEKPLDPKGCHIIPPFYIYKKEDIVLLKQAIENGVNVDAPGSFVGYLCSLRKIHAMDMPGLRYDIGNLESYEKAKEEYRGIIYE